MCVCVFLLRAGADHKVRRVCVCVRACVCVCVCVFACLCLVKNDSPGKNHQEHQRNIISPYNQIYSTADDGNNPAFNVVNIA